MEKDFYTDDFEQLLKDTTEDFRMYPSRKVWHSIYNDLHPAKKWPSFAVSLLLITAILYVGIHNNNTINADADNLLLSNLSPVEKNEQVTETKTSQVAEQQISYNNSPANNHENRLSRHQRTPAQPGVYSPVDLLVTIPVQSATGEERQMVQVNDSHADHLPSPAELKTGVIINEAAVANVPAKISLNEKPTVQVPVSEVIAAETPGEKMADEVSTATGTEISLVKNESLKLPASPDANLQQQPADKMWMEDYAFHNKRSGNKWKTKFSTLVYITPSIGYRILNKNTNFEPVNALLIRNNATSVDADDAITQQAALNLESGASAILDITRKLRVKAGVQFNYTNYVSFAQRLSHPTQTNVLLNDLETGYTMLVPFSTSYGNQGDDNMLRLNNKTAQFSIPLGADYRLAGNDKIKWYIGATIQPTYVAGGNAYLVSSDYKNYVEEPSMLRKWNMNAGFESFVSYKTKSGAVINIGPQFRYQLLSTYSNRYTYTENLYNLGFKFGITRKF
jgi:hypothetical protein